MSILTDHSPIPQRRAVEHPSWCSPQHCATTPDTDAELLVIHRAVLLDEQLVLGARLLPLAEAVVRVRGLADLTELRPEPAGRLAAAAAAAAEIAGGAR